MWCGEWSPVRDSNPQPADYKSAALPVELTGQMVELVDLLLYLSNMDHIVCLRSSPEEIHIVIC